MPRYLTNFSHGLKKSTLFAKYEVREMNIQRSGVELKNVLHWITTWKFKFFFVYFRCWKYYGQNFVMKNVYNKKRSSEISLFISVQVKIQYVLHGSLFCACMENDGKGRELWGIISFYENSGWRRKSRRRKVYASRMANEIVGPIKLFCAMRDE